MRGSDKLRAFLARMLGWSNERAVELALRSVVLALDHRATLVLCGEGSMVPIARALHRRTLGPDSPLIVCDPRRGRKAASVRSPESCASGVAAFEAAVGGSLCVRMRRLPEDFQTLVARLRGADDVLCVLCASQLADHPPLILPAPLARRSAELDRIIAEYAGDAIAELDASPSSFTADDHAWVRDHAASSLAEIEAATLRLVTLRTSRNLSHAAERLGMAPVSLFRWLDRRGSWPADAPDDRAAYDGAPMLISAPSDRGRQKVDHTIRSALLGGSPCDVAQELLVGLSGRWQCRRLRPRC